MITRSYDYEYEWMSDSGREYLAYFEVEFTVSPGRPAVMYLRNGDPGYPEEPAELEVFDFVLNHVICQESREKVELPLFVCDEIIASFAAFVEKDSNGVLRDALWDHVANTEEEYDRF